MKKKKSTKKFNHTTEYDSKRQQNVLLDKIYSEVKTVGEGHSLLSDKIEEVDRSLRKLESKSFGMEMDVQAIKSKTGTIDIKIDRIEKDLEPIKTATIENSNDTKEIKDKLEAVIDDHENRLHKLESARQQ